MGDAVSEREGYFITGSRAHEALRVLDAARALRKQTVLDPHSRGWYAKLDNLPIGEVWGDRLVALVKAIDALDAPRERYYAGGIDGKYLFERRPGDTSEFQNRQIGMGWSKEDAQRIASALNAAERAK